MTDKGIEAVLRKTQTRLNEWYKDAAQDYGVDGWAEASVNGPYMRIVYTENSIKKVYQMQLDLLRDEKIDYFFNCWMEQAE